MHNIPDPETVQREIQASYVCCRRYGVNPEETRNPRQKRLTDEQLAQRLGLNRNFLDRCTGILGKPGIKLAPETENVLLHYTWPGNVRKLENLVERAANLDEQEMIHPNLIGLPEATIIGTRINPMGFKRLAEVEKKTIMDSIEATNFNLSKASHSLLTYSMRLA